MWTSTTVLFEMLWTGLTPGPDRGWPSVKRAVLILLILPVFVCWCGLTQLMHALDEVFFRAYRRVQVTRPIFIVGVPRSGTTYLHTVLSNHPACTSLSLWECLFAPSVCQRWLVHWLARLDSRIGGPVHRTLERVSSRLSTQLDGIHTTGLAAPEEDYLTLLPDLACLVLVALFPNAPSLEQLGDFRSLPAARRRYLLTRYDTCLRKHLYWHGSSKRLLSKNAAFASWVPDLIEYYVDATFIVCLRDPRSALPSQLSALEPAIATLDSRSQSDRLPVLFNQFYAKWFHTLLVDMPKMTSRYALLNNVALKTELVKTVSQLAGLLNLHRNDAFDGYCQQQAKQSRTHRSRELEPIRSLSMEFDNILALHDFHSTDLILPA